MIHFYSFAFIVVFGGCSSTSLPAQPYATRMNHAYAPDRFAPAPSYALESDSEDEAFDADNRPAGPSRRRAVPREAVVRIDGDKLATGRRVVVMIGEAGERVLRRAKCNRVAFVRVALQDDDDDDELLVSRVAHLTRGQRS